MTRTTDCVLTIGAALILGALCLFAYLKVGPTLPKKHRLRALTFLMTLPLVVLAMTGTTNPLPAVISLIQVAWRQGPSG